MAEVAVEVTPERHQAQVHFIRVAFGLSLSTMFLPLAHPLWWVSGEPSLVHGAGELHLSLEHVTNQQLSPCLCNWFRSSPTMLGRLQSSAFKSTDLESRKV